MLKSLSAIIALGLIGISTITSAADNYVFDDRFYVTPKVSYGFFGQAHKTPIKEGNGQGYGIAIGKPINKYWNIEAYYFNFDDVDSDDASTVSDREGYGLTALYFPAPEQSRVFLLGGYAVGDFAIDGAAVERDVDYLDLGYGYMHQVNDYGVSVRLEYRYRQTDIDSATDDADNHIVSMSLQIPLGKPSAP